MTITHRVQDAFFDQEEQDMKLIRLAPNAPPTRGPTRRQGTPWTHDEHERFLQAMEKYPSGPWKVIAAHVGSRNTRQTMTHAQKYRQKIARWKRGVPASQSPPASPPFEDIMSTMVAEDSAFWMQLNAFDDMAVSDTDGQFEAALLSMLESYEPLELGHDVSPNHTDDSLSMFV